MSAEVPEAEEFIKVDQLKPESRGVNTIVKVASKSETREVLSRRDGSTHRVTDALVGDETASIYLTLWDESIDKINEAVTLRIRNAYVNLFKGSMRLNLGRYGEFEVVEDSPIAEVNTGNNLSDKQYEQERRYPTFRPLYRNQGYEDRRRGGYRRSRR